MLTICAVPYVAKPTIFLVRQKVAIFTMKVCIMLLISAACDSEVYQVANALLVFGLACCPTFLMSQRSLVTSVFPTTTVLFTTTIFHWSFLLEIDIVMSSLLFMLITYYSVMTDTNEHD